MTTLQQSRETHAIHKTRMTPPHLAGVTHATRASTIAGTSLRTKEGQPKTMSETAVTDTRSAMEYLINGDLKSEDDELTWDFLSAIAMQLSQRPKISAFQTSEAFKALSYVILDLHKKRTVEAITDVIAKAVSLATKRVREELDEATEQLTLAVTSTTNTALDTKRDCRLAVQDMRDAVETAVTALENAGAICEIQQEGLKATATEAELAAHTRPTTYADRAKKPIPAVHATMVAKAELQKRKIRLIKAAELEGEGLGDLTEKQWVEKANMALELMDAQEEKPNGTCFVGVSKEREEKGVIFEMNSGEAAGWIRDRKVMAAFLAKMGSTVDFKAHTYEVVMDWVPISFDAEEPAAWKRVEQSNGLRESAIQEAAWIKPTHLRTTGQRTAIAVLRMASREDANQIIEGGLFIEGKKVWGRKQVQEPKRCLKCQCFGEHKAAKCASIHDVCGRCGNQHRTSLCTEDDKGKWECSNCKATGNGGHKGHGAADRRCPIFLARVDRMNNTRQENRYKYFCTTDPATWETHQPNGYDKTVRPDSHMQGPGDYPCHTRDEQNGGDPHTQGYNGGSQGWQMAGGRKGGGKKGGREAGSNTQRQADKGGEEARALPRAGGSKDKDNGNAQTGALRSNGPGVTVGDRGQRTEEVRQGGGNRVYRQETQREPAPSQRTLNDMWKGKERDLRSWSEDINARMRELEMDRNPNPYSYD